MHQYVLNAGSTLKNALEKLNKLSGDLALFVIDSENILLGTITDGDIRRAIISGHDIGDDITAAINRNCKVILENKIDPFLIREYKKSQVNLIPIVNERRQLISYLNLSKVRTVLPLHAIFMAGGKGERLKPLTNDLPKPMLPLNGKPILDHNVDRLIHFGVDNIHVSVNFLREKIKDHFGNGSEKGVAIGYIEEDVPLGTIGSLRLVEDYKYPDLLVMNSDILSNLDLEDLYQYYKSNEADMVVATIGYSVNVPYAVIETKDHVITALKEKPSYTYLSNAGIYIIRRDCLKFIPANERFDTTDLIEKLIAEGKKVLSYQILDYWLDIGRHEDYEKAQQDIHFLKL